MRAATSLRKEKHGGIVLASLPASPTRCSLEKRSFDDDLFLKNDCKSGKLPSRDPNSLPTPTKRHLAVAPIADKKPFDKLPQLSPLLK